MTFNSSVVCVGNGASHVNRINQRQQHNNNGNKHDDGRILWHDVVSVVGEGNGGVGHGGNHGLGVDGECMPDRGFRLSFKSSAHTTTTMNISSVNDDDRTTTDNDDKARRATHAVHDLDCLPSVACHKDPVNEPKC